MRSDSSHSTMSSAVTGTSWKKFVRSSFVVPLSSEAPTFSSALK